MQPSQTATQWLQKNNSISKNQQLKISSVNYLSIYWLGRLIVNCRVTIEKRLDQYCNEINKMHQNTWVYNIDINIILYWKHFRHKAQILICSSSRLKVRASILIKSVRINPTLRLCCETISFSLQHNWFRFLLKGPEQQQLIKNS